jgi:hypothetical protein
MNFRDILNEIEKADPKVYEQQSGRRDLLKSFGAKVALAALPIGLGTLLAPKKAAARTTGTVIDSLNFALELAYLQYNFYHTATNTGGLIPNNTANNTIGNNDLPGFQSIEANEKAHILFLNTAITSLGGTPFTPNNYVATNLNPQYVPTAYDFTKGGAYSLVFSDYQTFLLLAQVFQDTIVRGLKGQITLVTSNTTILTQMLQIHSVEARHASHVRTVRRYTGAAEHPAPWITNDISPSVGFQTNYKGEDNLIETGGIVINNIPDKYDSSGSVPKISATAAFDETLDNATVMSFFTPFML